MDYTQKKGVPKGCGEGYSFLNLVPLGVLFWYPGHGGSFTYLKEQLFRGPTIGAQGYYFSDSNPYSGVELNFSMGFNLIAPYMDCVTHK